MNAPRRDQTGQEMVEFALALPLFLALLVGLFYAGILLYSHVTLNNAARVGTTHLVRHPLATNDEVENVIEAQLGVLDPNRVQITIWPAREARVPFGQVDVSLRYRTALPTLSLPNPVGAGPIVLVGPVWLQADSTMNFE